MLIVTSLRAPTIPNHIKIRTKINTKFRTKTTNHTLPLEKMSKACNFEIFGRVQGVYFRKYTREEAQRLGIVGWVKNTDKGTVIGEIQGKEEEYEKMKEWLTNTGSPYSKIENAVFKKERQIDSCDFDTFSQRQ